MIRHICDEAMQDLNKVTNGKSHEKYKERQQSLIITFMRKGNVRREAPKEAGLVNDVDNHY